MKKFKYINFKILLLFFIGIIFSSLIYLSIPVIYDYKKLKIDIEKKISKEFNVKIEFTKDIKYRIFPYPYLEFSNAEIYQNIKDEKERIGEIKKTKISISITNIYSQDRLRIKKVILQDAIFKIQRKNLEVINKLLKKKLSSKNFYIKKSKVFFEDDENTVAIFLIDNFQGNYLKNKSRNQIDIEGIAFNSNFEFKWLRNFESPYDTSFNLKFPEMGLNLNNNYERDIENFNKYNGNNSIVFPKSQIKTNFSLEKNVLSFLSKNSKIGQVKPVYDGLINFDPFFFEINIKLNKLDLSNLIYNSNWLYYLIKDDSFLLNENLNGKIILTIDDLKLNLFDKLNCVIELQNGILKMNDFNLISKNVGKVKLKGEIVTDKEGVFKYKVLMNIKDSKKLYAKLQTPKKYREKINTISFDIQFRFRSRKMTVSNLYIDSVKVENNLKNINEILGDYFIDKEFSSMKFIDYKKLINNIIELN